ncbi:hypothetical protein TUM19329_11000 [Legionella antarctica]|uniref:Uncharacterized protein n=1 Tax=Legionella antarctica TaxID=2708020 RepID=A0A6F8T2T0_9GAMM|nr:BNR-4 repeat-containing protein [Legionella antarctica]BCA94739.1 hypothetical protein TUM19329_11000 [Legionella antarctica]
MLSLSSIVSADNTILTTIEEFNFKQAPGFKSDETYSQVWHFKESTYLVWVDPDYRAQITQIKNGKVTTVPLDENPDYVVQKDGHHRFSLGVDKLGYVHVTGDMHNYTDMTSSVITPYPARYQKKKILYWRSNKAEDITGKFSFMGDTFDRAMRGSGWMMGRFFTDNKGELFYSSHVQAFRSSTNFGQMGVGLYKYSPTDEMWTAIGDIAPVNESNITYIFPVLYWEYSGYNNSQFQNYQPVFKFDKSNNMYFALTGNTVRTLNGANRLLFAKSEDGGMTWKRANDTVIAGLPIRGISGLPNSADIILDTGTENFLEAKPGLNIDSNGKPGVMVQNKWRVWDGETWSFNTKVNYDTMLTANMGYRLPDNSLIFNATGWNKLLRTSSFDSETIGYDFVGYDRFIGVDDFALKNYGVIYGIGQNTTNEAVLKTTITQAPLPAVWADMDIDDVFLNYKGNAGYLNGRFVLTTYGAGIGNQSDSLHYTYKKMQGDGEITARVTAFALANDSAGLMMRETLNGTSKQVSQLLYPLRTPKYTAFQVRSRVGGYPSSSRTDNIAVPYWLRIKRTGDIFTGFISPDGITWKQTSSATVPMANEIYVGLAASAARHRWYMDGATFENVIAPADICQPANPTISLSPSFQSSNAGGLLNYAVAVINNDSPTCPNSNFVLTQGVPGGLSGKLTASELSIAPGAKSSTNIEIASSVSTPLGDYSFTVKASNGIYTSSANGTYQVKSSCVLNAPTISISPENKTSSGDFPSNYIVNIISNDTPTGYSCERDHRLSPSVITYYCAVFTSGEIITK